MATNEVRQISHELPEWMEPIAAYAALRDLNPLLLDGMGAHPEARHAYLALGHVLDARILDRTLTVIHDDGAIYESQGEPLELLRTLLAAHRYDAPGTGFTGGFVGYFGYEFSRAIERTLPAPKVQPTTPDMALRLCRDVLRFDRETKQVTLIVNDLPGEAEAANRAQHILAALAASPTLPTFSGSDDAWTPSMSQAQFVGAVEHMRELIADGDLFQANIATKFQTPLDADPVALYAAVQRNNPSPFMALMDWGDHAIVSNSPEQLFAVEHGVIRTRPIAGTRPRSRTDAEDAALEQELLSDPKEQAEHTMLVDLLRNDIARVSSPGTVRVAEKGSVERYQRVMHLVSRIEGTVRDDTDFVDWLAALFPGGTITGAPKHRACMRIHEAEPVPRGPYTGSAGFLSWDQQTTHWNILIRTLLLQDGTASVHAGSGIVMGSDAPREWLEAGHKAQAWLDVASGAPPPAASRVGEVTPHGSWNPPAAVERVEARVLLVDNYDSFVHNLADYCGSIGAAVHVIRNDEDAEAAIQAFQPTHVILSPGPGWPEASGSTWDLASSLVGRLPVLGVCLGHQALAAAAGATIRVLPAVHGESDLVQHEAVGLHEGLPSPLRVARYHSLVVDEATLPDQWRVTARLEDGTVMAMEHRTASAFGLQYHPESFGSDHGLDILIRFLKTA